MSGELISAHNFSDKQNLQNLLSGSSVQDFFILFFLKTLSYNNMVQNISYLHLK